MKAIIYETSESNANGCIRIIEGFTGIVIDRKKREVLIISSGDDEWTDLDYLAKIEILP